MPSHAAKDDDRATARRSLRSTVLMAVCVIVVITCGVFAAIGVLRAVNADGLAAILGGPIPAQAERDPDPRPTPSTSPPPPITFAVTGDGPVDLAYSKDTWEHDLVHVKGVDVPWQFVATKDLDGPYDPVIKVRRKSGGPGSVTCEIKQGGEVISTVTATGPRAEVTC